METSKVGKRGTVVVPARLRRKFGIEEGQLVLAEERPDGILIRPAVALPVEIYTPERKAEFLLSNAVDPVDYRNAAGSSEKDGARVGKNPTPQATENPGLTRGPRFLRRERALLCRLQVGRRLGSLMAIGISGIDDLRVRRGGSQAEPHARGSARHVGKTPGKGS